MAIRKVITERQRLAANLVLAEGMSGSKALRQAGYGKAYARNLGRALRRSWGLREAFREQCEMLRWSPKLRRQRLDRRYDKRRTARAVINLALEPEKEIAQPTRIPKPATEPHEIDKRLRPPDRWCPGCQRKVYSLQPGVLDQGSGPTFAYVCDRCTQYQPTSGSCQTLGERTGGLGCFP